MDDKTRKMINTFLQTFADAVEAKKAAEGLPMPMDSGAVEAATNGLIEQLKQQEDGRGGASWPPVQRGQCIVSTWKHEKKRDISSTPDRIAVEIRKFVERHATGDWLPPLGVWFDSNGELTLDVNHVFTAIHHSMMPPWEALYAAVLNQQHSIYFVPRKGDPRALEIPRFPQYREFVLNNSYDFLKEYGQLNPKDA